MLNSKGEEGLAPYGAVSETGDLAIMAYFLNLINSHQWDKKWDN